MYTEGCLWYNEVNPPVTPGTYLNRQLREGQTLD
jgi:hypothetical protein